MAVRSKQLGIGTSLSAAAHDLYTVPAGYRTIVKSIVLWNRFGTAQRIVIGILDGATLKANFVQPLGATSSATELVILQPWIVMIENTKIQVAPQSGTADVIISGTELEL